MSSTKMDYDATKLLQAAKARSGRPYMILITDGLPGYHAAFKKVFGSPGGFIMHIRNEFCNANKQEKVNGTFADRTSSARGTNWEDSLVYHVFALHYNYIRPHVGIGGKTPAEAAGIKIRGHDKWLTLIRNVANAA